jgi:aconitase A
MITRKSGGSEQVSLTLRIDTDAELHYMKAGGILPFVLSSLA